MPRGNAMAAGIGVEMLEAINVNTVAVIFFLRWNMIYSLKITRFFKRGILVRLCIIYIS